ncbi:DNA methylase [Ignicoccus islandicus DSM 13165]|uniref:DNA methylase n=1 Tax=Ignicoccus islandicus DSM 13165 TaxID=940295 RepID=A0A0U3EBB9_9CREN|nr:hypothetical protein [Ignicoccus islandicus]ALU11747.1 DNA methylase [Ignicoccus islandicus DSM 13165]
MITKKALELELEKVLDVKGSLGIKYEQYVTPSNIAADVLWRAFLNGDVSGKVVADLGCGTGKFSYGVELLGGRGICVEVDWSLLSKSPTKEKVRAYVPFVPLRSIDTVIMNPPFGTKKEKADRPFWMAALAISKSVYSLQPSSPSLFKVISNRASKAGFECEVLALYKFPLKMRYEFHRSRVRVIETALYYCRKV